MAEPETGAAAPETSETAPGAPPPGPQAAAPPDPALERERWLREQLDRAQRRPAAEPGMVVHPTESGLSRFWRWLIDDLRSERRAAAPEPDPGALVPLWQRLRASLPQPARRRRRRRRRR
ncbi:MAG: hypothetical protein U1E53_10510 [Dongiaceae bacterium]